MKPNKPYFSHDEGARNDPKLLRLMQTLVHEGKSVYWDLVEMLYEQGGYLLLADCETYAFSSRTNCALIMRLVNDFGLFEKDDTRFWSKTALNRLEMRNDKAERRAAAGAKGGKARAEREAAAKALLEQEQSNSQAMLEQSLSPAQASKVKESKGKESKGKEKEGGKEPAPARSSSPSAESKPAFWPDEAPVFQRLAFFDFAKKIGFAHADLSIYWPQIIRKAESLNEQRDNTGWEDFIVRYFNNEVKYDRLMLPTSATSPEAKPEPAPMPDNPTDLWGWNTAEPATTYQPAHEPA